MTSNNLFWSCTIFVDMKRVSHLILYIWVLSTAPLYASDPSSYLELVQKADEAIKESKWLDAEELLVSAMRAEPANPGNILLMSNLGMVRYSAGKDSLALQTLNDVHFMAPNSVTVLQNRARVLLGIGKRTEAFRDFSSALKLDSTLTETRFYHSILALEQGLDSVSKSDIEYLETHFPKNRYTNLAASIYYRLTNRPKEAIPYLSRLIETEKSAEHFAARAMCEMMTGDLNGAAMDVAEAISLEPADGDLYLQRAILHKMRYRPDDARADGQRAIKLGVPEEKVKAVLQ